MGCFDGAYATLAPTGRFHKGSTNASSPAPAPGAGRKAGHTESSHGQRTRLRHCVGDEPVDARLRIEIPADHLAVVVDVSGIGVGGSRRFDVDVAVALPEVAGDVVSEIDADDDA